MTRTNTWANVVSHIIKCARCAREKVTWVVYCLHTPSVAQIAISCKRTYYNNFFLSCELHQFFIPLPPWRTGRRRRMPPVILLKRNRFCTLFSWFLVEAVHYCDCGSEIWSKSHRCIIAPICLMWDTNDFDISNIPLGMDGRSGLPAPIYPFRCTSPRSNQFWVANHDMLSLVGSDREFHQNSFWYISSSHCGATKCSFCASVLPCRAPRGRPFLMT